MLANYLPASLLILLLIVVKSLKSYFYCFPEIAWFFGICTNRLYQYGFPVSLDMLSLDVLAYTMLSLVTCLISPSCHVSLDTQHATT